MIDKILDLSIKNIKGIWNEVKCNQERNCWRSSIMINKKTTYLGYFNDPFSAGLVYSLVKKEICLHIDFKNKYIRKTRTGRYCINKKIKGKDKYFGTFHSLEDARRERDLLVKYDWNIEKVCECVDETVDNKIIFNNYLVGIKA